MFSSLFQSTAIPAMEQVVNFSEARHTLLAGNIANMDTPGYQARDLSVDRFQSQLKESLASQRAAAEMGAPAGVVTSPGAPHAKSLREPMENFLYHDGSDDSLEQQVAELSKNQIQHNLALTIMNSQFRLLETAISERV